MPQITVADAPFPLIARVTEIPGVGDVIGPVANGLVERAMAA